MVYLSYRKQVNSPSPYYVDGITKFMLNMLLMLWKHTPLTKLVGYNMNRVTDRNVAKHMHQK